MRFTKQTITLPIFLLNALVFSPMSNAAATDAAKTLSARDASLTAISWPQNELNQIIKADDLHIAPFREDGVTYGTPTWIWCVEVDGNLYVRAYNGQRSSWYQAALREKAGKVIAAGITKEVRFEPVQGDINTQIDNAYKTKYQGSSYLNHMISDGSRNATIRIIPLDLNSSR
ncbi:hypothetical protein J2125_003956 [Erwinia toletana]|uniref:DUF2255 family protein n=1 Tax=Winslowiella toletana TaxID=92490 RepID=A0ABS4PDP3_9GAMM|nr:DUF2255 family protein [Winslowiella toletana]MBP2170764.1 hypothetical protein [Winslowiella toletana]